MTYEIRRVYHPSSGKSAETIKTGLTLEEAQEHCEDEDTSTSEWFDCYTRE